MQISVHHIVASPKVLGAIAFAKELTESLHKLAVDATREEKQQAKIAAAQTKSNDQQRLSKIVTFDHALRVRVNGYTVITGEKV